MPVRWSKAIKALKSARLDPRVVHFGRRTSHTIQAAALTAATVAEINQRAGQAT